MQSRGLSATRGLLTWRNSRYFQNCPLYRRVFHCIYIVLSYANMSRCMNLLLKHIDLLFRLTRIAARVNDVIILQT